MSREEAIMILKCAMPNSSMGCGESDEEIEEAMTMAIKALEEQQNPNSIRINFVGEEEAKEFNEYLKNQQPKEPVLDKIKDEIEIYEGDCRLQGGSRECERCNDNVFGSIYRIIDKYKAESEGLDEDSN